MNQPEKDLMKHYLAQIDDTERDILTFRRVINQWENRIAMALNKRDEIFKKLTEMTEEE